MTNDDADNRTAAGRVEGVDAVTSVLTLLRRVESRLTLQRACWKCVRSWQIQHTTMLTTEQLQGVVKVWILVSVLRRVDAEALLPRG